RDRLRHHLPHVALECSVEERGFLATHRPDDLEGESHVRALVAEDPVRPARQAVEQPARAEKIDVREGGKKEEPLDARREADEVQEELSLVLLRPERGEVLDRIDPSEAKLGFLPNRRDGLDRGERASALIGIGDVRVEECKVELYVERLFV